MEAKSLNILLIGALPPPLGGATLLVKALHDELDDIPDIRVSIINISRRSNRKTQKIWVAIIALIKLVWIGRHADVITLHASKDGRILFGPLVYIISRLLRKPLINRAFGGAFDQQFESLPYVHKWIMKHTYLNAEVCLFETKRVLAFFNKVGTRRAEWFSNYTQAVGLNKQTPYRLECQKYVFLGRITETKGINELLEVAPLLDSGISLDIYGPLDNPYEERHINQKGGGRVRYCGVLNKAEISERLWEYDALVLPTYWCGEGYPAVILEAYAHGLPVVSTKWQSIPEIVDEKSGILIEPRKVLALSDALNYLHRHPDVYVQLQKGARERVQDFLSEVWTERFIQFCQEVTSNS